MKNSLITVLFLVFSKLASAQLQGIVFGTENGKRAPLEQARIKLKHAGIGATTDEQGRFELILPRELPDTMIITATGFYADTVIVTREDRFTGLEVNLFSEETLDEIIIEVKRSTHTINR